MSRNDPPLDIKRLVERDMLCRSPFCKSFRKMDLSTGNIYQLSCRSWRCERCRDGWRRKWSYLVKEALSVREKDSLLLLNLTTSAMISFEDLECALRWFVRQFRAYMGHFEYVKVVEYNKKHTQPHFHLILTFDEFKVPPMPENWNKKLAYPNWLFELVKGLWCKAIYKFRPDLKPTTVVWCQPPAGNGAAAAYYAIGYITGGNGHSKDEEPDATWRGRKLTYSRRFFPFKTEEKWQAFLDGLYPDRKNGLSAFVFDPVDRSVISLASYEQGAKFADWLNNGGNKKPPTDIKLDDILEIVREKDSFKIVLTTKPSRVKLVK